MTMFNSYVQLPEGKYEIYHSLTIYSGDLPIKNGDFPS